MNTVNSTPPAFADLLQKTLRCSRYAKRVLETDHQLLGWLQENYIISCTRLEMQDLLRQSGLNLDDETQLACAMRKLRKQVMVKLILRDLNGLAGALQRMIRILSIQVESKQRTTRRESKIRRRRLACSGCALSIRLTFPYRIAQIPEGEYPIWHPGWAFRCQIVGRTGGDRGICTPPGRPCGRRRRLIARRPALKDPQIWIARDGKNIVFGRP